LTTPGLRTADAAEVEALMPGVETAVRFLGIFPEYKVLVGCTAKSNPALIEAVTTCIRHIGADLSILVTEPPERNQPTPRVVMEAAKRRRLLHPDRRRARSAQQGLLHSAL